MEKFDPIEYKFKSRTNWNIVANQYHFYWASNDIGPFASTLEIVKIADIKSNDIVLDIACGTGAVSKKISEKLAQNGKLIGIDLSREALNIAKKEIKKPNVDFLEMDIEKIAFSTNFTKVFCQFALMFLTKPTESIQTINKLMTKGGKIFISVHGTREEVPYFSCIMKSIIKFIPNILPAGSPSVHSFGDPKQLQSLLERAGFEKILIYEYHLNYMTNSFEDYWNNYMRVTALSIRKEIEKDHTIFLKIKEDSKKSSKPFLKNSRLIFPWKVLMATGIK